MSPVVKNLKQQTYPPAQNSRYLLLGDVPLYDQLKVKIIRNYSKSLFEVVLGSSINLSGCSALEELDAGACESLETLLIENAVSAREVLNLGEMDALCSWSGLSPFDQLTELLN